VHTLRRGNKGHLTPGEMRLGREGSAKPLGGVFWEKCPKVIAPIYPIDEPRARASGVVSTYPPRALRSFDGHTIGHRGAIAPPCGSIQLCFRRYG
jgi:hypothetical protein